MGIQGLKPHIKQVCEIVDIATFKDATILVDASIYLDNIIANRRPDTAINDQ
jgi:hypothetical protein